MALTKPKGNMIQDGTLTDSNFVNTTITSADMALDPRDADNYTSGSVPLAQLGNVPAADTTGLDDDIALLGFKIAANGSLTKYNLLDQTVDIFEDASGIDAAASTNEVRNAAKYYSGQTSSAVTVSGNYDSTGVDGDYTWYKWTSTGSGGTYTTDTAQDYEYLVIAGGGSGASGAPHGVGGGGAGGYRTATGFPVAATTISGITVGLGGVSYTSNNNGQNGGNSVFSTITSAGGARGNFGNSNGPDGGSGGGGGGGYPSGTQTGGAGNVPSTSPSQGNPGGNGVVGGSGAGGGGGGAGSVGINGSGSSGGNGGLGLSSSIDGTATFRGSGGGGSGTTGNPNGAANPGGGSPGTSSGSCVPATANTGGGGGGSSGSGSTTSGAGGTGIVIIRRPTVATGVGDMSLVSNAVTAQAVPSKGDLVMTYTNGAGTAVINTNIKGYVSRDGGTTYTQGTLVSQGTTGGHTIASFHDLDISGQPSGQSVRYKIETLVQSAAMDTRIQAVSLGWS